MTDIATFESLVGKLNDVRKQLKEEGAEIFAASTKEIFEKYPHVGEFGWTQYTPYFNDGDECVFGVGELFIHSAEDLADEDSELQDNYYESSAEFSNYGDGYACYPKLYKVTYKDSESEPYLSPHTHYRESNARWTSEEIENPDYKPEYGDAFQAINRLYTSLAQNEQTLKDIFGDHVVIIARADGVEVEEYSHD